MAAGDVVDEVGQPLRHRGGRAGGEQVVQVGGAAARVERAADRGLGEPVDGGAARGLDVGGQVELARQPGLERARRDRREVRLQQHVVDRRGQGGAQRGDEPVGVVEQCPAGVAEGVERDHPERRGLGERPGDDLVAQPPAATGRAPGEDVGELRRGGRGVAGWELGEAVEHAAAVARGQRAARAVGQGVDRLARVVLASDEARQPR